MYQGAFQKYPLSSASSKAWIQSFRMLYSSVVPPALLWAFLETKRSTNDGSLLHNPLFNYTILYIRWELNDNFGA